jgi:hypothetical protein
MTNIFGNDKVYICPHCGSDSVGAEFNFYGEYNKPYESPSFGELTHQDSDWCYDCDKVIMVVEKE